jgi:hypothetical protein
MMAAANAQHDKPRATQRCYDLTSAQSGQARHN